MTADDPMWEDLFHGAAWTAFIDQAQIEGGRPDCEATRLRAYRYYEEALAAKNARCPELPLDDPFAVEVVSGV